MRVSIFNHVGHNTLKKKRDISIMLYAKSILSSKTESELVIQLVKSIQTFKITGLLAI